MLKFIGPLLFILPLTAQQTLPDLIVTASRVAAPSDDVPFTAEILDSETLIENASRTLPQAFLNTPGVLVQQTTPAQGSPFIRGFTGRRNLLLQDGIRLNNSSWRGGPVQYWNTLDSQAINRVELIKSQGSVLYGSDAIGGTVNVFSKSSHFREREGAFYNGSAYYRFDTNSKSNIGRLEQTLGQGGKWGLTVGLSAKDIGDIRDSALGRMVGTGYQEHSFDAKFEYAVTDTLTLTATHTLLDQDDISRWHSTINNPGWTHGSSFTTAGTDLARDLDQERSLSYIRLDETETNLTWIDSWQATASFQKTQDSEFRVRSSGRADFRNLDVDTYGLTLQAKSGNLVWGADYYRDEIDADSVTMPAPASPTPEPNGTAFALKEPSSTSPENPLGKTSPSPSVDSTKFTKPSPSSAEPPKPSERRISTTSPAANSRSTDSTHEAHQTSTQKPTSPLKSEPVTKTTTSRSNSPLTTPSLMTASSASMTAQAD